LPVIILFRIKDEVSSEFITTEAEYEFVCENDLWKVEYNLNLRDQIDDEILEAMRAYYRDDKKEEAVRRLNDIPIKYKNAKYHEGQLDFIWGSINGIHEEIYEVYRLYNKEGNRDEAVKRLEEIRTKYKNDRYDEGFIDMILNDIEKEEAEKEKKKGQWNKG